MRAKLSASHLADLLDIGLDDPHGRRRVVFGGRATGIQPLM
jgi:hypothetical protein